MKPQGIRGELKIRVYLGSAEDFKGIRRVFVDGAEYAVMNVRGQGETAYVVLKGVADRNSAELLRDKELIALREDCPEPPDGRYYIGDLIGLRVVTVSGDVIGEVVSVTPAKTDIYTISTRSGEVSFAAAEGVILGVDISAGTITVDKKRFKEVSV